MTRLEPIARTAAPVPDLPPGRRPLVSVITPCYNYGHFLRASALSVLAQEGVDVELVIVNDTSTDDSGAIADELAAADPRVKVVHNPHNTGHVVAFNNGYAVATGEYIVRLDADDLLTPGSLARATALFEAHPSVGLVYGHPVHFTTDVPETSRQEPTGWTVWAGVDWVARRCKLGVNCITTPEAMVRGSVMKEVGALDTRLKYAQDMEMWLRAASVSDVGRVDGADKAFHRDHAGSMSVNDGGGLLLDLRERRTVFDVVFGGPGGRLPGSGSLHDLSRRTLAAEALTSATHAYDRGLTEQHGVDELIAFALETSPDAQRLPQWRALRRRQLVGAKLAPLNPGFVATVAVRRLRRDAAYRRWLRTGV
ncbi:MAG: glycosyltransferase family 2 protein [Catenulispora sp.]|nr:glycosyltransferase family 2 protein [Catenulispora sp.]